MADGKTAQPVDDWKDVPQDDWKDVSGTAPAPAPFAERHPYVSGAWDVLKGAGKGAVGTLADIGSLAVPDVLVGKERAERARQTEQNLLIPTNTPQKVGHALERGAEFLLPGGAEERAGELAAQIPKWGRLAAPAARVGAGALATGGINALHGGSFGEGAATGGLFGAGGEVLRAAAPSLAEGALGVTRRMRGYGKTPGEALLGGVPGIRPSTIAENAQNEVSSLTSQLEQRAAASQTPVSTRPALSAIDSEMQKAIRQNDRPYYEQLQNLRSRLTTDAFTGGSIPNALPPAKVLELKRGIGNLQNTWDDTTRGMMRGTVGKVYGALDKAVDAAVPESAEINQRISSLIPIVERAKVTDESAGLAQRLGHRVAAHTGALAGAGIGGGLGYHKAGIPGAIAGAGAGMLIPELLTSPPVQMTAARLSAIPAIPRFGRGLASELLDKKKEEQ